MTEEFNDFFSNWIHDKNVFLVTGSDYKKAKEQVPESILTQMDGVFCCLGNELYLNDECIYQKDCCFPDDLIEYLFKCVELSKYTPKVGKHVERRPGQINFSIVGRNANMNQRKAYSAWDEINNEREQLVVDLEKKFGSKYEFSKGGSISIDISPIGYNKAQILKHIREQYTDNIWFFGDRIGPGGNDHSLACALINDLTATNQCFNISQPDDVIKILKEQ